MNPPRSDLLMLLKLLAGNLSAADGQHARQRIAEETQFRKRYHQVAAIWTKPEQIGKGADSRDGVPAELTAGFIDGALSRRELQRVETTCWASEAALKHVVCAYRVVSATDPACAVPADLSNRLMELHPEGTDRRTERHADHKQAVAVNGARPPRQVQPSRPPRIGIRREKQPRSGSPGKLVWVGGAALLILIAIAALFVMDDSDPVPDRVIAHPEPTAPNSPDAPGTLETDGVPEIPQPVAPVVIVDDPVLPESPVDPGPQPNQVGPGPAETVTTTEATISWSSVVGLLAVRGGQQPDWCGVRGEWVLSTESELAVLPESYAEGHFSDGVRILLDDDSRLNLVPDLRSTGLPRLSLEWGHLALFDLREGTVLPVPLASASETLQIDRDGTSFAVERSGDGGRLVVVTGELSLEGRPLGPRSSVVWDSDAGPATLAATAPPGWLDSRRQSPVLDDETLAMLGESQNVIQDLEATMQAASVSDADTIVAWSLALAPESAAVTSLNSDAHVVRVAALNWLADARADDPRRRTAWRAFAGSLDEPGTARQIVGWFRAAHEPARADRPLFAELLGGLDHSSLSVRETADFCLRRITGMSIAAYQADAVPAQRRQGIASWRALIARIAGGRPAGNPARDRRRSG